jgi:hypothetical protein
LRVIIKYHGSKSRQPLRASSFRLQNASIRGSKILFQAPGFTWCRDRRNRPVEAGFPKSACARFTLDLADFRLPPCKGGIDCL